MWIKSENDFEVINRLGYTLIRFGLIGHYCEQLGKLKYSVRLSRGDGSDQWGVGIVKYYCMLPRKSTKKTS